MKNGLKLNIKMFFEEAILKLYIFFKKLILAKKWKIVKKIGSIYKNRSKKIIDLLQRADLNKKLENYKSKKLRKNFKIIYK